MQDFMKVKMNIKPQSKKALLYSKIEFAIMKWDLDGTKTAGSLTRQILKIIKK